MDSDAVVALAGEILERAGVSQGLVDAVPVSGGANNRVFKITGSESDFLLKCYFQHPEDPRNRCKADYEFTRFAWVNGMRAVPKPLGVNWENHSALYEFVRGRKIGAGEITPAILNQASDFFSDINHFRGEPSAKELQAASEACFSIREHLACVQRRIDRLHAIDETQPLGEEAATLVREKLAPAWERICSMVLASDSAENISRTLKLDQRCLSPSDFGFHNALQQSDGTLRFFDFEYAGWDDPAKMICDFFCQPEIPVAAEHFRLFTNWVLAKFEERDEILTRAQRLLPVYRIKWCCIILNEFLAVDLSRRKFSDPVKDPLERKRRQLAKVVALLEALGHNHQPQD